MNANKALADKMQFSHLQRGDFKARLDSSIIADYDFILNAVRSGEYQVADCRNQSNFYGENPEPTPCKLQSHFPTSASNNITRPYEYLACAIFFEV